MNSTEIDQFLDSEGCPTGNEQRAYTTLERVQNLATVKNYFVRQTDEARKQATEYLQERNAALLKLEPEPRVASDPKGADSTEKPDLDFTGRHLKNEPNTTENAYRFARPDRVSRQRSDHRTV